MHHSYKQVINMLAWIILEIALRLQSTYPIRSNTIVFIVITKLDLHRLGWTRIALVQMLQSGSSCVVAWC